jgi:N-acetylneuraminic acid mutarotase
VNAAAGTTMPSDHLVLPRNFIAAAPLPGGSFVFTGGFDPAVGSVTNADIYAAGAFTSPAQMTTGREAHTATALGDGRVLVAGGLQSAGFTFHQTAEIFDPTAVTFTETAGNMISPRAYHVAAWIDSQANVLLVAGANGPTSEVATAELFDPSSGTFAAIATSLAHPAKALAGVLLDDARLLVAGGSNQTDNTLSDAHVYDPKAGAITPVAPMNVRRMAFSLTKLADGRVLAVGGWSDTEMPSSSTGQLEVYDPIANTWTLLAVKLAVPRHDHVAVLLPDCRVAIMGGQSVMPSVPPVAPTAVELVTVPTQP